MKLGIIIVSTRKNRVAQPVADWTKHIAETSGEFDQIDMIDLRAVNLPVFSEPHHPATKQYESVDAQKWSQRIDPLDAVIFVTPEYDYFAPASLVNAIDYLAHEWAYKPAAFVSYGGISGGLRSVQSAKPLLTTVKMMPIPEAVSFHFVANSIKDDQLVVSEQQANGGAAMLTELGRWASALRSLRN